jgi:transposase
MDSRQPHVRSKLVFRNAQVGLFEGDPRDLLTSDSLPGWLVSTLDRLDLSPVHRLFDDKGGVPYEPKSLLGVLLLGGLVGRTSSRDLEECCLYDVRFIYVSGGQTPDYRTIARFRSRIAPAREEVFRQIVRLGMEDGLVKLGRVSLDSTKVSSAASSFRRQMMNCDGEEEEPSDPDAVRLMGPRNKPVLGYTVQAAVDTETDFVVSVDVGQMKNDRNAAGPMLEKIEETTSFRPSEMLCDAGYDSHTTHHTIAEAGVLGWIATQDSDNGFWSMPDDEYALCPMGHPALPLKAKLHYDRWVQSYRVRECSSCIFKPSCCPNQHGRTLQSPVGINPLTRLISMRRIKSPEGRLAMQERMSTIEPVFGDMKWNHGLTRLRHRTLVKAKAEVLSYFVCRNLKKMYKEAIQAFELIFLPNSRYLLAA